MWSSLPPHATILLNWSYSSVITAKKCLCYFLAACQYISKPAARGPAVKYLAFPILLCRHLYPWKECLVLRNKQLHSNKWRLQNKSESCDDWYKARKKNNIPSTQDDIFSHTRGLRTPSASDEHVINICFTSPCSPSAGSCQWPQRVDWLPPTLIEQHKTNTQKEHTWQSISHHFT